MELDGSETLFDELLDESQSTVTSGSSGVLAYARIRSRALAEQLIKRQAVDLADQIPQGDVDGRYCGRRDREGPRPKRMPDRFPLERVSPRSRSEPGAAMFLPCTGQNRTTCSSYAPHSFDARVGVDADESVRHELFGEIVRPRLAPVTLGATTRHLNLFDPHLQERPSVRRHVKSHPISRPRV